jgi:hypothetical protein
MNIAITTMTSQNVIEVKIAMSAPPQRIAAPVRLMSKLLLLYPNRFAKRNEKL